MKRYVIESPAELAEFLKDFGSSFAFDTETTSLKYTELEIEGISLCDGKKACYIDFTVCVFQDFYVALSNLFKGASTIIAHNIVFDMKVLHKYGIDLNGRKIYDTMIADHLINENREHGLKFLAKHILGHGETMKYEVARAKGGQTFIDYATNDAIWTWELCMYQQPLMKSQGLVKLFREIEMPFQFVLLEMELNGMEVDMEQVNKTKGELKQAIEDISIELLDELGERPIFQVDLFGKTHVQSPINFNSGKVLGTILFEKLKLPVVEYTPAGAPAVGKNTLSKLAPLSEFVRVLQKYKIAQKLLSAFFEPMENHVDSDGMVRPSFRDTGTKTGRLSCNSPNLQQLPKVNKAFPVATRNCFIAGKGRKMITCDYSGQEIRVMAQISQDPTLIEALNNGYDMHLAIANQFYKLGIPEECLVSTHKDHEMWKEKFKNERTKAKTITFGLAYGKGAYGFSQDFGISESEAQEIVDEYFDGMPKLREAIDRAHKEVKATGAVSNLAGRKRHFETITKDDWTGYSKKSLRQAFNFQIQGFSADMMRIAMIRIQGAFEKRPEMDLKIVATVHDECIMTCKEEYLEEAKPIVKAEMENAVSFVVPVVADLGWGDTYEEAK